MDNFSFDEAKTTTAEKEISNAIRFTCKILSIQTMQYGSPEIYFKADIYRMLHRYTKTPKEICELMNSKKGEIQRMIDSLMEVCDLSEIYKGDVSSDVNNMVEKYLSINYPNKDILKKDRDAYPLQLKATDEEESKVEQTAALEEPLQSKAIFFDNKKMLQKNQACDGVVFSVNRIAPRYCSQQFNVKVFVKKDFCTLKFTEYTMEEDIVNVLFSLLGTSGNTGG